MEDTAMTNLSTVLITATRVSDDIFHIDAKNDQGLFELLESMDTVVGVGVYGLYKFNTSFKKINVNLYEQVEPELLNYNQVSKSGLKILNRSLIVKHSDIIAYYKANGLMLDKYVPSNPALFFAWTNYQKELQRTPIKIRLVKKP
jgi:hypothetical protein